tara:strand:- start:109 stop:618 length:510 start_codon:yes stop_codon:yes gene_type:complete
MSFENCKKMRKRRPKIPFGIYYDYRNDNYERNLCLYNALSKLCNFYEIKIGNYKNVKPERWIKHLISRENRRKKNEMGDTIDVQNFIKFWNNKGYKIAILFVDGEKNFKEGFVNEDYKNYPDHYDVFVIEWQDSYNQNLLHFEAIDDDDEIDNICEKFLTQDNEFLTWL